MHMNQLPCDGVLHSAALQNFKRQDQKVLICAFNFFRARALRNLNALPVLTSIYDKPSRVRALKRLVSTRLNTKLQVKLNH